MSRIIQGDCMDVLKTIESESVNCCVTSPPYYGLRDYGTGTWIGGDPNCPHRRMSKKSDKTITGHAQDELIGNVGDAIYKTVCPLCGAVRVDKQIGLEETPEEYVQKLTQVFHEVKRILKDDGTLWLNIGDSYASNTSAGDKTQGNPMFYSPSREKTKTPKKTVPSNCKPKDLIGIPWMLAFSLRADGWYLRQDIIWHKPNPMPESVKDRCTKSHEYIFLLSKKPKYYFDYEAIKEKAITKPHRPGNKMHEDKISGPNARNGHSQWEDRMDQIWGDGNRNKRDVWSIGCSTVKEAHFATYPEELVRPCILAGCPIGGTVLDPFFGSGTTGRVAESLNREYIGIELNPEYIEIENRRLQNVQMSLEGFMK